MDNINMTEEEYKALYNRIKEDLYDEFINPETATYGLDVLRQKEPKDCLLYTSPSPRDYAASRMPSSA